MQYLVRDFLLWSIALVGVWTVTCYTERGVIYNTPFKFQLCNDTPIRPLCTDSFIRLQINLLHFLRLHFYGSTDTLICRYDADPRREKHEVTRCKQDDLQNWYQCLQKKKKKGDDWSEAEKLKWHHIFIPAAQNRQWIFIYCIHKSYYANEVNTIDVSKKCLNTTVFNVCFCKKKASLFLHFSSCLQSVIGY